MGRMQGKTAVIVGAGQTPGATIGNGRNCCKVYRTLGQEFLTQCANMFTFNWCIAVHCFGIDATFRCVNN